MHSTQRERDKLMTVVAVEVTRRRKARGLKLNHLEALALTSDELLEGTHNGKTVVELISYGRQVPNKEDVVDGAERMIIDIEIEAMFPNSIKSVTVHRPIV